jgi:hypothetical protein
MPGRQAKLITPLILRRILGHIRDSHDPARDRVIILLSVISRPQSSRDSRAQLVNGTRCTGLHR